MSDILTPLADCPVSLGACCPQGTDAYSIYQAQKSLCAAVEYILGTVNVLKGALPDQDRISSLQRTVTSLTRRVERLEKSAITCISWNGDTCEIQGAVLVGPLKVFPKDPCAADLADRVVALEADVQTAGSLTALTNQVASLDSLLQTSLRTLTLNGPNIVIETISGSVSSLDVRATPAATLIQATYTTGVADVSYAIPFSVDVASVIEIDLGFLNSVAGKIYNLDVQTSLAVSLNTYNGLTTGTITDDNGTGIFHKSRKALINLPTGMYNLVITEATAAAMVSLQISTQIKSLP